MKNGNPTCIDPVNPECFYMRNLFHEYFWGPFETEQAVIDAIDRNDTADPYWDYNPFCIIKGLYPLPKDYVYGFPFVDDAIKARILAARKRKDA